MANAREKFYLDLANFLLASPEPEVREFVKLIVPLAGTSEEAKLLNTKIETKSDKPTQPETKNKLTEKELVDRLLYLGGAGEPKEVSQKRLELVCILSSNPFLKLVGHYITVMQAMGKQKSSGQPTEDLASYAKLINQQKTMLQQERFPQYKTSGAHNLFSHSKWAMHLPTAHQQILTHRRNGKG